MALLLFLLSPDSIAQQSQLRTRIKVSAQDEAGQPVAGVAVQIKLKNDILATVATDEKGESVVTNFPPGTYEITVSKEGFQSRAQSKVDLNTGLEVAINFVMVARISVKDEVNVTASVSDSPPEQSSSTSIELTRVTLRELPTPTNSIKDALPLLPGVVRSQQGEIKISGTGENRSAFIVNSADVTDPATGQFGMTVPVDSVESINVFKTPYLAQYGRFTAGVVSVETRRGGDKWRFELNDPFPEFRYLNGHLRGLRDATPRVVFNGPLIKDRLFLSEGTEYTISKRAVQTLEYPNKETITESVNSFTQLDYIVSDTHTLTGTFHLAPRKDKFHGLDFFNRREVTPNFSGKDYTGTLIDRLTLGRSLLESLVSVKDYTANVWGQGVAEMILTPTGNRGNYFSEQGRQATRTEWTETLSLQPISGLSGGGSHNLKFGSIIGRTTNRGELIARPVNIRDANNNLLRRIEFAGGSSFNLTDWETHAFAQDHWNITPKVAMDIGLRFERQSITDTLRFAPRVGLAWTPFNNIKTVFRAGAGFFYDRVPLGVYAFDKYPEQVLKFYSGGNLVEDPRRLANITGRAEANNNPFLASGSHSGNFSPYSATWNVELEHSFARYLKLRVNYLTSNSDGVVVVEPKIFQGKDALVLSGSGESRYRQFEITAKLNWGEQKQNLFLSYVRSNIRGNINEFNTYIGNFPFPVVRPDQNARLSADLPHRFLGWGTFHLPWKLRYSPIVEFRSGFPYSTLDARQLYVGEANRLRFPKFFSFDSRVARDFQINPKYAFRFSVSGFNLTNRFNPLDVHRNIADPQHGLFFGNFRRFFRLDFDVIF
ncbi:MAG: carboxypeptidase regulatory-like domain-containing protein [Blastocatellia bacterium]